MAILSMLLVLILNLRSAVGWTYTEYLIVGSNSNPYPATVSPTGSVSPTATSITTAETAMPFQNDVTSYYVTFNVTVTDLYLGPNISACAPAYDFSRCTPTIAKTSTSTIRTSIWAPVIISNPSTCTQTSFTYTTSSSGFLQDQLYSTQFPGIFAQAAETGSYGEALFVTTYISTISVNLGGQAVTTTRCDIWLKDRALEGIGLLSKEHSFLTQCVDPRRYLCSSRNSLPNCGTDWIGTYPATAGAATAGAATSLSSVPTTGSGNGPTPSSTTKAGGVTGVSDLLRGALLLMALTATASICILL